MALSKAEFDIVANVQKAQRDIASFSNAAQSSFKILGAAAVAAVGVFASRKLFNAIRDVTDASAKQELAVKRLNTSLKLAGDFSEDASKEMQQFATDLQKVTTVGDETALEMLALAKSFNVSNEDAKKLVATAADLAEATGGTLEGAVRELGKTYSGTTGLLSRQIPVLKDLTKEQLRSGEAINIIAERFKGAAAAATQTYTGAMIQLSNAMGDFKESIGAIITENPLVIQAIHLIREQFENMSAAITRNSEGIQNFVNKGLTSLINFLPIMLKGVSAVATTFIDIATGADTAIASVLQLYSNIVRESGFTANAVKLVTAPINALILAFNKVQEITSKIELAKLNDQLKIMNGIMDGGLKGAIGETLLGLSRMEASANIPVIQDQIKDLEKELESINQFGKIVASNIETSAKDTGEKYADAAQKAFERRIIASEIKIAIDEKNTELVAALERLKNGLDGNSDALGNIAGGIKVDASGVIPGSSTQTTATPGGKVDPHAYYDIKEGEMRFAGYTNAEVAFLKEMELIRAKELEERRKMVESISTFVVGTLITAGKNPKQAGANILGSAAGAGADLLFPGSGGAVTSLVTELAMGGKEGARAMVEGLVEGIPQAIDSLAEALPELIIALAENSGEIITALATAMPKVSLALAKAMPKVAEALVMEVVNGVKYQFERLGEFVSDTIGPAFHKMSQDFIDGVKAIPDFLGRQIPTIFEDAGFALVKGIRDLLQGLGGALSNMWKTIAGDFLDGLVENIRLVASELFDAVNPTKTQGGIIGKATGNDKDGKPIEVQIADGIKGVFDLTGSTRNRELPTNVSGSDSSGIGQGGSLSIIHALTRIEDLLKQPITSTSSVTLNSRAFADITLQLKRANSRLTA